MSFPTTVWTQIKSGDHVVRRYTEPVYRFLMYEGASPEDARDLTQDVMLCILKRGFLEKANRAKGHFRSLLLAVTKAVLTDFRRKRAAKKRGGVERPQPLDDSMLEALVDAHAPPADQLFDTLWHDAVVRRAFERLAHDSPQVATILRRHYFEGSSYAEIAEEVQMTVKAVTNAVHRAKPRLKEALDQEIRSYCSSDAELQAELSDLRARLG